jgi:hypothetical protein
LDKFGKYYAWFLLIAVGLPAVVRLFTPRQFAQMTSERISDEKKRKRHRWLGWGSILGSLVLVPVWVFYSHARWIIVAFIIGVITGIEMVGNAAQPQEESLVRQSRIFGVLYLACAIFTYFFVLRT